MKETTSALWKKECTLSASPLSYWFLTFTLMALIPNYPITLSGFFVCFGLFHTFQNAREANDILFTAFLPIAKKDVVSARIRFVIFIQGISLLLSGILVTIRMLWLSDITPYNQNNLLNANLTYLGVILWIFSAFLLCFVCNFFQTAYKLGKPFILFGIAAVLCISYGEVLPHLPGLQGLNTGNRVTMEQWILFLYGLIVYILSCMITLKVSQKRFDKVDL